MPKLLLSDALAIIAPEALPADTAMQPLWISAVCQQFLSTGKWAGTTLRWKGTDTDASFAVYEDVFGGSFFTLPRNLLCVLAAGYGQQESGTTVRFSSEPIRGQWHEFGNAGYGSGDAVASSGVTDAGEGFTTFRDFSEPSYMRIKTDIPEIGEVLFRGLNENGEEIYTGTSGSAYQGIRLNISTGLTTTTTQKFNGPRPSLIQKPATRAQIRLYAVSVATGVETYIGRYEAGETTPSYRRYRIACGATVNTVHAMVKRRHVPAIMGADEVIPGNPVALEYGLMGRRYDLASDPKTALEYWSRAYSLLNNDLGESQGSTTARLQMERGSGLATFASIH